MSDPKWVSEARRFIGLAEIKGGKHNPAILRWWQLIRAPFTDDETPWCAGFVGGVLEAVGIKSTRSAAARSYLQWGETCQAIPGCVVIFERGPKFGHVGFLVGKTAAGHLMVLGGNQGDKVSIAAFDPKRVLGYRWPTGTPRTADPLPLMTSDGNLSSNEA